MQQHLPFTVLKLTNLIVIFCIGTCWLQQHLPFTVLKRWARTNLTEEVYRELQQHLPFTVLKLLLNALIGKKLYWLQQHLPFTVLKLTLSATPFLTANTVATAPTVYGIETPSKYNAYSVPAIVATAPTVYGIETYEYYFVYLCFFIFMLQQHLPFTVLKPFSL